MYITLDTALPVITLLVVAYQAYSLYELDKDMEELVDKHNEFVETVATVFETILEIQTQEDENQ
jgi:hypothetical protein